MKKILCPIDGSDHSYRALALAIELAGALEGTLTVLVVREYIVGRQTVAEIWTAAEVESMVKRCQILIEASGLQGTAIVERRSQDASYTILDFATQGNVDMIVMGAAGKGALKSLVVGSVSNAVLRNAACPVTIVH